MKRFTAICVLLASSLSVLSASSQSLFPVSEYLIKGSRSSPATVQYVEGLFEEEAAAASTEIFLVGQGFRLPIDYIGRGQKVNTTPAEFSLVVRPVDKPGLTVGLSSWRVENAPVAGLDEEKWRSFSEKVLLRLNKPPKGISISESDFQKVDENLNREKSNRLKYMKKIQASLAEKGMASETLNQRTKELQEQKQGVRAPEYRDTRLIYTLGEDENRAEYQVWTKQKNRIWMLVLSGDKDAVEEFLKQYRVVFVDMFFEQP